MRLIVILLSFAVICFGVSITAHTMIHLGEAETSFMSILIIMFKCVGGLLIAGSGAHFLTEELL